MSERELQFVEVGTGEHRRRIAALVEPRGTSRPGLLWLPGLKSDMISTKASALAAWARDKDLSITRFDYSGHGRSEGEFEKATVGDWLEEAMAVFTGHTSGPQIIVGSSTGGHVALLLLRRLMQESPQEARRVRALVLIAPAWDLTEELMWKAFPDDVRKEILTRGVYHRPSAYGEPYAITRQFIEEGRNHLFNAEPFDPGRPVVILQGRMDVDVPVAHARRLAGFLTGGHARLIEVPDGEHRMSRPQDLELMYQEIERLL